VVSAGDDAVWIDYVDFPATSEFNTVGVEEIKNQTFLVYPNPAKDVLFVDLKGNETINSIKLFNSVGQLVSVHSAIVSKTITELNIQLLSNGIYYLQLNTNNGLKMAKVIIAQ
jgi:threonine synthase